MNVDHVVAVTPNRDGRRIAGGFIAMTAMTALFLAPAVVQAGGSGPTGPSTAVKFEPVPGSKIKRVILTARAVERLGIETGKISEQRIIRKQMVGGQITHPLKIQAEQKIARGGFGSFGQAQVKTVAARPQLPNESGAYLRLTLSEEEWNRVAKNVPARVLPLATRGKLPKEVSAIRAKLPPLLDPKRSMLRVYYIVPGTEHSLKVGDRMRVELQLSGSNKKRKIVPYSAVYYDGKGKPWVYTTAKPLVYERKRVSVERIVGELAVLTGGPPVGTEVVTVGSSLLFGAEVIYKR
ncbi:MAG: hypothetical protein OEU46_01705 [Alphaproteobacteria bacterium]|nr:hypothetical protein [Alphaproteobacteria bacterium]